MYDFNLRVLLPYLPKFAAGVLLTLEISAVALLISIPLGFFGALMRVSGRRALRTAASIYVEAVRNVPLLVVLYVLFYAVPQYGLRLSAITAGVLALAINSTAFTIEIFRGALSAIAKGQYQGGRVARPAPSPDLAADYLSAGAADRDAAAWQPGCLGRARFVGCLNRRGA